VHLGNKFPGPQINTNMKANILTSIQEESSISDLDSANPETLNIKEQQLISLTYGDQKCDGDLVFPHSVKNASSDYDPDTLKSISQKYSLSK